jgi:alanine-glyoxylate transaminase / serine-glyoxylate transaminase / serine-pyruvate transaminase
MLSTATKALSVPRRLLYGPGPSMVEPRALAAMSLPVLGIRDPDFLRIVSEVRSGLRNAFGTDNAMTFPVPGSGTSAMEAAIANFVQPGSKVGVFAAGHFANRAAIIAARYGANVVRCERPWGEVFSAADADEFIDREKPNVVIFVQAETSTGAYQSGKLITAAARRCGALVIADTVTSLGAMPVELDAVGIDVAFSCSQKGLSCPAGLSPISMSPRAFEWLNERTTESTSWYLDLKLISKYFEPPHLYHHTPSPPLYYAMHEALAVIEEEGLRVRLERHRRAGERLTRGLVEMGFKPLVERPEDRIWHLTIVVPPEGMDEAALRLRLFEDHDIEIHSGLGQLAGKILRIGTMGPLATDESVDYLLHAMQACV